MSYNDLYTGECLRRYSTDSDDDFKFTTLQAYYDDLYRRLDEADEARRAEEEERRAEEEERRAKRGWRSSYLTYYNYCTECAIIAEEEEAYRRAEINACEHAKECYAWHDNMLTYYDDYVFECAELMGFDWPLPGC